MPEALKGIDWRGRILIDATNAHMDPKPDISLEGVSRSRAALKSNGRTSSELVAEMAVVHGDWVFFYNQPDDIHQKILGSNIAAANWNSETLQDAPALLP